MQQLEHSHFNCFQKTYRYILGMITITTLDSDILMVIPSYKFIFKKIYQRKIMRNIDKILYSRNIGDVVLSDILKDNTELKNFLYSKNFNILNGKRLFEILTIDCLTYISKKQKQSLNNMELHILSNAISQNTIDNIIVLADKIKVINIVTNNIKKFSKLEEKIRNKFGIITRITNNKRKSLQNAKIILNLDFPEELVNQYKINPNAIIINVNKNVKIYSKIFSGINIQDYMIKTKSKRLYELKKHGINKGFSEKELYESTLINLSNFYQIRKCIKNDKTEIVNLVGCNGMIDEKEYMKFI